eukprot:c26580_g1_i1 orf=367-2007(-)
MMEQLVNFVIRPPRAEYIPSHDLLRQQFILKGRRYQREDSKIINSQGRVLECSHYMPFPMLGDTALPCVIYCHGNSGCRADAREAAIILLPSNITVFTLDFSGSGLSEGNFVTLGWNETEDLKTVVSHLRSDKRITFIGLWGRSMGAVTSVMYGAQDPSIAGMVLDSPFSNLVDLMMELVDVYKVRLPKFTLKVAIQYMRRIILRKAQFDIMDLDVLQFAKSSFIPALFGHGTGDLFIQPHHSDRIYEAYAGDKNIIKFEGDHNSPRPQFYYDSITIFFYNVLQPPETPVAELAQGGLYYEVEDMDMGNTIDENLLYEILNGSQLSHDVGSAVHPHSEDPENSSEEGIDESHSQWQMSRMEFPIDLANPENDVAELLRSGNLRDGMEASSSMVKRNENGDPVETINTEAGNECWSRHFTDRLSDFVPTRSPENFAKFPSTEDDEERMVMEAIAASLQDVRIGDNELQPPFEGEPGEMPTPFNEASSVTHVEASSETSTPTVSLRVPETIQPINESQTPTLGMFETLGQRWGIGLFRATRSRRTSDG